MPMEEANTKPTAALALAGPGLAVLHETDLLPPGLSASLWPVALVALVAAVCVIVGLRIAIRHRRWTGLLVAIPNGLILLFYGFLLLFFGLDGSR